MGYLTTYPQFMEKKSPFVCSERTDCAMDPHPKTTKMNVPENTLYEPFNEQEESTKAFCHELPQCRTCYPPCGTAATFLLCPHSNCLPTSHGLTRYLNSLQSQKVGMAGASGWAQCLLPDLRGGNLKANSRATSQASSLHLHSCGESQNIASDF